MQENYIEEDEIDLRELFKTIYNNKFKIMFLTFVITSLTIVYTLSLPNSYKSEVKLVQQGESKANLGGLGALAGMAGINIGGGAEIEVVESVKIVFEDKEFQEMMIEKYNLVEKFKLKKENLIFALSYDGIYNIFHSEEDEEEKKSKEEVLFDTYKKIIKTISISADKKTSVLTMSATCQDRFLAKELVDMYLKELSAHIRSIDMKSINKQIKYYNLEIGKTADINIKTQLGDLITQLIQKKVLLKSGEYYKIKQLTSAKVAYVKDKAKPKRGLIVIVSFITSIILGIFGVFFLEFLRNEEESVS